MEPRLNPGILRAFTVRTRRSTPGRPSGRSPAARPSTARAILPYHRVDRPAPHGRRGHRRARAQRADRRGPRHRRRLRAQRLGRVGGADRPHGRDPRRRGDPGQGDHDRDEPPAGEHGDQPLHDAGRRRHPRPDPHGQRDRDDRHPRPPTRTRSRSRRRRSTRCSTTASGWCPASARRARCACGRACGRCSRTRRPSRSRTRATSAARTRWSTTRARRRRPGC